MSPIDLKSSNPLNAALQRCNIGFLAVILFSFAINLLMLTAPLYMLQVFDRVLTSNSLDTLLYLTIVAAFAFLALWGLEIVRGRVMISLGLWLDQRVSGEVLAANLNVALHQRSSSIQPIHDLGVVRNFLTSPGVFPIIDAPWTPVFLAIVFLLHPILGWIGLAGAIVLFIFALANDLASRGSLHRAGLSSHHALEQAQAAVRNADVIQAMGMRSNIVSRWHRTMSGSLMEQARGTRIIGLITSSSKFARQLLQIAMLGVGAWLVIGNELSPGGMIAGSILMARALAPVEQAIGAWRSATSARTAYRRIKALLAADARQEAVPPLPKPKGTLSVEGVSYAHPGEREPVLRNISFTLLPGESLGLIGPTAVGKTTLARILVGNLTPQRGHARLDGADIAEWDGEDRGQYIGYLPQDIELFSGTVRENISRLGESDPNAVYKAARLAGVHDDILALPKGYDTEIGVAGMALSGGQRQRIALARAAFGGPAFLVLDEPNSNLDLPGESALFEALTQMKEQGSTIVIIAHRPSVLRGVDKILVLRDGAIEMMGPRDEIIANLSETPQPPAQPARPDAANKTLWKRTPAPTRSRAKKKLP